jgi:hypothetical protein
MRRNRNIPHRKNGRANEQGTIITLIAVFMLFVVGAMAALSVDVVTIYTARSEAQLAADGAALAAARVLANSGATSDTTDTLMGLAQPLASKVAIQVAEQNQVGGVNLTGTQVSTPVFGVSNGNPTVTVRVQASLPTFFARIWGSTQITVAASATAEAYNPSGVVATVASSAPPVAPLCVKPWLLPNMDPSIAGGTIFNAATGVITDPSLLGWTSSTPTPAVPMSLACDPPNTGSSGDCSGTLPNPQPWQYYPGNDDPTSFPHPTNSTPTCSSIPTLTNYQASIAGCVQTPLACNSSAVNIDLSNYPSRDTETADAVNCLTHATTAGGGDTVVSTAPPSVPFQFVAGTDNPIPGLPGSSVVVSDSLVTVPVFNSTSGISPTNPVQIVGFVQLFLNPTGTGVLDSGPTSGQISTTVINLAGCGTNATGTPIIGNGASPVAVRLISPP